MKGVNLGKKNGIWKGDTVGYKALHAWIMRHKPKPEFCERCHKVPPYDLANISGKYKRDVNDFEWLCRRCHMESDGRLKKLYSRIYPTGRGHPSWKGGLPKCVDCNKQLKYRSSTRCMSCEYKRRKKWNQKNLKI